MTKEEIIEGAKELQKKHPYYRFGQAVFNYCDEEFGSVARIVQFEDNVDCFYIDEEVDNFIEHILTYLNKRKND